MNDSVLSTGNWMQKKSGKEKIKLCMKSAYRAVKNQFNSSLAHEGYES